MKPHPTICLKQEIARIEAMPHEAQAPALVQAVRDSFGDYSEPGKGSHLFEATHMGIHVRADTQDELCRNWLRAAKNCAESIDPAHNAALEAYHLELLENRVRALSIISACCDPIPIILDACAMILRTSSDPLDRLVASEVAKGFLFPAQE